jgi:adenylate cyclase class 2
MGKEREIKLRIADLAVLRRALRRLGARVARARLHERNVLFETAEGWLAGREQLLRIRTEAPVGRGRGSTRSLVTFKRPLATPGPSKGGGRHKVREEIELEITDPKSLATIFEGLGLRSWFQYEKFRTTFRLPASNPWARGLLIELDETPIGVFLELEGPANAIDRVAKALGFEAQDYVLANYMTLYQEYCRSRGEEPRDMLFVKKKSGARSGKTEIFRDTSFFS